MNISLAQNDISLDSRQAQANSSRTIAHTLMLLAAFTAFQAFNYSTTVYALKNLLGSTTMAGTHWSVILAVAFCSIDVAGIARLFTPGNTPTRVKNNRSLFVAWMLTASLNALLTWYGVVIAISIQQAQTSWVVNSDILIKTIPIFLILMVWTIRILIVGAFSRPVFYSPGLENLPPSVIESNRDPQMDEYPLTIPTFMGSTVPSDRTRTIPHTFAARREPTYRGLPIRYKTN